jgi:cephalosporin-C deacetylase-like acetyl esterase
MPFAHGFPFDPSYGYSLDALLAVEPPPEPAGFGAFWRTRYDRALEVEPNPRLRFRARLTRASESTTWTMTRPTGSRFVAGS